jgi:hypothetical protein
MPSRWLATSSRMLNARSMDWTPPRSFIDSTGADSTAEAFKIACSDSVTGLS